MKLPLYSLGAAVLSVFTLATHALASLSIDNLNSPVVINFNDFDGSGFSPTPSAGQLDSNMWAVDGFSDGSLDFGGTTEMDGNDFARGNSSGGVITGGIWAFDTGGGNIALGIQPGGGDWTPGSLTLKLQNNTGQMLTALDVSYSIYLYNNAGRASSFDFSHSADNVTYTQIGALDFQSPETASNSLAWEETSLGTTLTGLSIADSEHYYLRWSGDDFSGGGLRDEFGLDNISITAVPEPAYFGLICGLIVLFVVGKRVSSLKSD